MMGDYPGIVLLQDPLSMMMIDDDDDDDDDDDTIPKLLEPKR